MLYFSQISPRLRRGDNLQGSCRGQFMKQILNRAAWIITMAVLVFSFAGCGRGANVEEAVPMEETPEPRQVYQTKTSEIAAGDEAVGYNRTYRSSSELCQKAAELYFKKGKELWGDEYDIVLGGGFFQARSPYSLQAGDVKYSTLQSIFPFDNQLVLCSVKGSDLLNKFINTSNSNYYVSYVAGLASKIEADKTYYIVVDSYTSTYAPNRLTEIMRWDADIFARDLIAEYIADGNFA